MDEIKNFTSTSFGLLIAHLLPGLAGLYTISLYSAKVRGLFEVFRREGEAESHGGLLFLMLLAALIVGALINAVHQFGLYRWWLATHNEMKDEYFANVTPKRLALFIAAVDEFFRAQQFYGSMALILPFLYVGWGLNSTWTCGTWIWSSLLFLLVWRVVVFATIKNWNDYVKVGTKMLHVRFDVPAAVANAVRAALAGVPAAVAAAVGTAALADVPASVAASLTDVPEAVANAVVAAVPAVAPAQPASQFPNLQKLFRWF